MPAQMESLSARSEKRSARSGALTARSEVPSDAMPMKIRPNFTNVYITPKFLCLSGGGLLLLLLGLVPIWNSITLLQDSNYVYWAGRSIPYCIISVCIAIVLVYVATVAYFFNSLEDTRPQEKTIMMVVQFFITVFGLFLMLAAVPLTHQTELTFHNLMHNCDHSEQTHRLFEYSTVLQNIRATPECSKMNSIEECHGYEDVPPYTTILKGMENNFLCSGFCYSPPEFVTSSLKARSLSPLAGASPASGPAAAPGSAPGTAPSPGPALVPNLPPPGGSPAAASLISSKRKNMRQNILSASLNTEMEHLETTHDFYTSPVYPPTLFSPMNFQASCEGMAARDMKSFAGAIGQQTFIHGLYLVSVAVITGFMRLMTFCMPKA